jgi:hypothetical protein
MNRPYYALAALVVVLGGSAVAVGSARCQTTTASTASSRALCASSARDLVVAAHLFVQFDTSWEASRRAVFAGSEQGSDDNMTPGYDDNMTPGYDDSCGYDPYRGERYDAETGGDDDVSTFAEEVESWPSDERIDSGFRKFEGCEAQRVCGGNEIHCPHLGGRSVEPSLDCLNNESADEIANSEDECHRAYQQWLAEQEAVEQTAVSDINDESAFFAESAGDESVFFAEPADDAWKTAPVSTPDWISDYLGVCMPSLEEQYAQAELQAFRDAASSEYGPSLSAAPAPECAAYKDEYESLYNLDAYLIPEREEMEDEADEVETDNGPVVWSLGRIFGKVFQMVEEILPLVEEEAEELYDAADEALQQWRDLSSRLAMPRDDVAVFGPYSDEFDDAIISRDEQIIDAQPTLPVEASQSREMLASLAGSLRAAGQLLLTVADGLEAEAERVLSAEVEEHWSR